MISSLYDIKMNKNGNKAFLPFTPYEFIYIHIIITNTYCLI